MAIATLSIDIVAKLASLERDMGKAARIAEQNSAKMERAFKAATAAFAALGVGVSVQAFERMVTRISDSADGLSKLSERTGVAVEELSKLQFAAELNDASLGDLERGLKGLSNKMLEAAKGGNDAAAAFAAVGVSVTDSSGALRPVRAVLDDVADSFATMEDGAGKAAIANKLMEESGLRLIPTLNKGADGLRAMGDEAERAGQVISTDLATASVEFNDNLQRISGLLDAVAISISGPVIKALGDLAGQFLDARAAGLGFFDMFSRNGNPLDSLQGNLDQARRNLEEFRAAQEKPLYARSLFETIGGDKELARLEAQVTYFEKQLARGRSAAAGGSLAQAAGIGAIGRSAAPSIEPLARPARTSSRSSARTSRAAPVDDPFAEELAQIEARIGPAEAAIERFRAIEVDAALAGAELTRSQRAFFDLVNSPEWAQMPEPWQALARAQFESADAAEVVAANQARLNALLDQTPTAQLEKQREEMQFLADAFLAGKVNAEQFGEAANTALGNIAPNAEAATDAMSVFADQAARNAQDAFADFLFNPFDEGLEGMVKNFGITLQRMLADAAAAEIFESIFGSTKGAGGTRSGGIDFGNILNIAGSFFAKGGVMTSAGPLPLHTYATGGVANTPQVAVFGEGRTPEAFVPLPDGRSIPVKVQGGGGGNAITINQTFNGAADPAAVRVAAGAGARQALAAFEGAKRYG